MPLTRRLVVDTVRRSAGWYAAAAGFVFLMSWLHGRAAADHEVLPGADTVAYSLAAVWFLSFLPAMVLDAREIAQLPISRRHYWETRWWLAVLPASIAITAAVVLGALVGGPSGAAPSAQATLLYCSLYGGCFMAVTAAFPLTPSGAPGAVLRVLVKFFGIGIGGLVLPFATAKYLPMTLGELSGPSLGVVIGAGVVTVASYFYQPATLERSSPPRLQSGRERRRRRSRLLDYLPGNFLTGLPRLFWVHAREMALFAPFGFLLIWIIEVTTGSGWPASTRHLLHRMQLMPFDIGYAFDGRQGFNVMIWVFVGMGHKLGEFMQRARPLRVLPMTANTLSVVFCGLSVTTAAVIWLWLLAIHVAVAGGLPPTLRLDIFVVYCGAMILMRTAELAIPSQFAGQFAGALVFIPLIFVSAFLLETPHLGLVAAGVFAGAAGGVIQAQLLRRRHKVYQFKPPTFLGKPMPS